MEPGLGLGIVEGVEKRHVDIRFPASRCQRRYAMDSAPLRRVEFRPGDTVQSRSGLSFKVVSVLQEDHVYFYHGEKLQIPESDLDDHLSFTHAADQAAKRFC